MGSFFFVWLAVLSYFVSAKACTLEKMIPIASAKESMNLGVFNDFQKGFTAAAMNDDQMVIAWAQSSGYVSQSFRRSGVSLSPVVNLGPSDPSSGSYPISVSGLGTNTYVVVYDNRSSSSLDIKGEIYSVAGVLIKSFIANSVTSNDQHTPFVTVLPNGNFVVVWTNDFNDASGTTPIISGQIFDSDGNKIGSEFDVVSVGETTVPHDPICISFPDNKFLVAFQTVTGLYGQMYDSDGNKVGALTYLSTRTSRMSLASIGNDFVSAQESILDLSSVITATIYSSTTLSGIDGGVQVSKLKDGSQSVEPSVGGQGDVFAVAYSTNKDGNGFGMYGGVFDSLGNQLGREIKIHDDKQSQTNGNVLMFSELDFTVVYTSTNGVGVDFLLQSYELGCSKKGWNTFGIVVAITVGSLIVFCACAWCYMISLMAAGFH